MSVESVPVYVINLERSPRRLEHIHGELERQGLGFTRVSGIDGADLNDREIDEVYDRTQRRRTHFVPLTRGEIACALSHQLAWRTFIEKSDAPFALFLEDDAKFTRPLAPVFAALMREDAPRGWDMIKLYNKRPRLSARKCGRLANGDRLLRPLVMPIRSVAQILSRAGAKKLLQATLPLNRPIDTAMQYWWEMAADIRVLDPPAVDEASAEIGGSDIRRWQSEVMWRKVRREIVRPLYRVGLLAQSLRHFSDPVGGGSSARE